MTDPSSTPGRGPGGPHRPIRVGVTIGHSERVVPADGRYEIFFALLESHPVELDEIEGPLLPEVLASFDAVLIGAPARRFEKAEVRAVRRWTRAGGCLLLLSDAGGDETPRGRYRSQTNLGQLLGRSVKLDSVVVRFLDDESSPDVRQETTEDGWSYETRPFTGRLELDVSPVLGRASLLTYELGALAVLPSAEISEEPDAAGRWTVWPKGRRAILPERSWSVTHLLRVPEETYLGDVKRRFKRMVPDPEMPIAFPADEGMLPFLFLRREAGRGSITFLGSSRSFRDAVLACQDNVAFLLKTFELWLPALVDTEIRRRWSGPQRHRLLQGYPMAPSGGPTRWVSTRSACTTW